MESVIEQHTTAPSINQRQTTNRLKVLWFTTSPSLSRSSLDGSYNVGTSWIEAMEELVHDQTDIELAIAFIWKCPDVEMFRIEGSSTKYFKIPRRPIGKWSNFARRLACLPEPNSGINDYLKVVEQFQPDVINFFGSETPFPQIIPHIDIPNVIWFQGNLTVYHQKWHAGITPWQSLRAESIKSLVLGQTDTHDYLLNAKNVVREKRIFASAENFIGRTTWDQRLVSTMAPQAQYHHCDEVMRTPFYKNQWQPKRDREKFVIVSTFRDNLYKGLETAMAASQLLASQIEKDFEWRIIGVPDESHYVKVCRKAANFPGNNNLKIVGLKSASEMIDELLGADLFVHPSHIDNSPNSVCEAMLLGLPVVSTNVGGIPTIIRDNEEGLLVQNGDPYAMAGAILDLYQNPEKAIELAQAARNKALMRNDKKKIISDLLQVYYRIRNRKKTLIENIEK